MAVTAKRGRFADGAATSVETANVIVGPAPVYVAAIKPKILGTFKSGKTVGISRTLAQIAGAFVPAPNVLLYRWYRNGA